MSWSISFKMTCLLFYPWQKIGWICWDWQLYGLFCNSPGWASCQNWISDALSKLEPGNPSAISRCSIFYHDFVGRIDAKHTNDAEVTCDWRVTEPDKLVHVPDKLPIEYLNKLYQMLDELRLNFGAFDIIRDEDDTLYFIKLNPNGQWYWIEIITKMPVVRAIV
jgi:hypothetical protein